MSDQCELCEGSRGEHRFDIASGSGVIPVVACKKCKTWAVDAVRESADEKCAFCEGETSDKYSIFGYGEPNGPESRICDDCRHAIAFSDTAIREVVGE